MASQSKGAGVRGKDAFLIKYEKGFAEPGIPKVPGETQISGKMYTKSAGEPFEGPTKVEGVTQDILIYKEPTVKPSKIKEVGKALWQEDTTYFKQAIEKKIFPERYAQVEQLPGGTFYKKQPPKITIKGEPIGGIKKTPIQEMSLPKAPVSTQPLVPPQRASNSDLPWVSSSWITASTLKTDGS